MYIMPVMTVTTTSAKKNGDTVANSTAATADRSAPKRRKAATKRARWRERCLACMA